MSVSGSPNFSINSDLLLTGSISEYSGMLSVQAESIPVNKTQALYLMFVTKK